MGKNKNYIFQSVATKFAADRDDAISKINRALDCEDPSVDVEKIIYENIIKLSEAKSCIQTICDELSFSSTEIKNNKQDDNNS